jgi:hypothetical protein
MELPFNPLGDNPEGPIPPVDPADLRRVWEMQHELRREDQVGSPGEHVAIGVEMYKRSSSPGANVGAVWYRLSMVHVLNMLGMLAPWIHDGVPTDSVFKA